MRCASSTSKLGPRDEATGWPAADVAVIEQEEEACPFGRVTHRHGTEAIATYTAQELTAEHARLMDHARQHHNASLLRLADLTQRAANWANKIRATAHANTIHTQADKTRARITR